MFQIKMPLNELQISSLEFHNHELDDHKRRLKKLSLALRHMFILHQDLDPQNA